MQNCNKKLIYFPHRQEFDSAINLCEGGKFYSSDEAKTFWRSHPGAIDASNLEAWLKSKYVSALYREFDFGFYKDSLSEVYVEPVILPIMLNYRKRLKVISVIIFPYILVTFSRKAFAITLTELSAMAAAAIIGLSIIPKAGKRIPAAIGTPAAL